MKRLTVYCPEGVPSGHIAEGRGSFKRKNMRIKLNISIIIILIAAGLVLLNFITIDENGRMSWKGGLSWKGRNRVQPREYNGGYL